MLGFLINSAPSLKILHWNCRLTKASGIVAIVFHSSGISNFLWIYLAKYSIRNYFYQTECLPFLLGYVHYYHLIGLQTIFGKKEKMSKITFLLLVTRHDKNCSFVCVCVPGCSPYTKLCCNKAIGNKALGKYFFQEPKWSSIHLEFSQNSVAIVLLIL